MSPPFRLEKQQKKNHITTYELCETIGQLLKTINCLHMQCNIKNNAWTTTVYTEKRCNVKEFFNDADYNLFSFFKENVG